MAANLQDLLDEKSERADRAIEAFLRETDSGIENLHDGILYAMGFDQEDVTLRGKRIRPALCLIACEALGGDGERALPFAMAVELMHNFFLVHDDIQDGDQFRRGRPSVWQHYGISHAINIGDYLFTKVFAALISGAKKDADSALQLRLWDLLVGTLDKTHIGQALDMNALRKRSVSVDDYMEIVINKTGYYLAAPMLGGAMVAGAEEPVLQALRDLGRYVGPVFQIVDDLIDLTHGKGRETTGSDIREGKRSYLVAYTAAKADEGECEELFRILDLAREDTGDTEVEWVRGLFDQYGAIDAGRTFCRILLDKARLAMAPTPERLRRTLLPIFESLLERKS
ncbi:polyprenyl synthetase family protein [bacterium]|nr:polyprenyl synthetase family protein [bacterium]